MYEIREVMAVFGFVQNYANCTELCDKLDVRNDGEMGYCECSAAARYTLA